MGLTTHVVRGGNAERLLILLHGLGADERDLSAIVPHLDPDGRFVAVSLRGQYSAPPGYAWFQFGGREQTASTLQSSLESLDEALADVSERYAMPLGEAVFGGFSQGAAIALIRSFRRSDRPKPLAVLSMSGFLLPPDRFSYDWEADDLPPVLVQHGTEDPLIPIQAGRETARGLAENGAAVVYREYPMEHQVTMDSIGDARAWLDRVLAGGRPNEPDSIPERTPEEEREIQEAMRGAEVPRPAEAPPETPRPAEAPSAEGVPVGTAPEPGGPVGNVTEATFEREVLQSETPVIVDFWAPWCAPCRQIAPIIEQIAHMRQGSYKVVKLNVDEAPRVAQTFGVQSIPMVGLFRNGRLERQSVGVKPRPQLEAELGMLVIP